MGGDSEGAVACGGDSEGPVTCGGDSEGPGACGGTVRGLGRDPSYKEILVLSVHLIHFLLC